ENYLTPAKQVAESLSKEYERLSLSILNSIQGEALRRGLERFVTEQAELAKERLRKDAEASGLGYRGIEESMESQRKYVISSFVQALEIAETRKRVAVETSWPSLGAEPAETDRADLTRELFSRNAFDRDLLLAAAFADKHASPLSLVIADVDD